jgi:acetylornithine deacetylase/succinyl-diaminopimelate desuccinylase-like protein
MTGRTSMLAFLFASLAAAQIPAINWKQQEAEILRHHRALIQIDSSNPPGNETRVVEYLKRTLEAEGIATKTFSLDPARANLVARIKGNGKKRPILVMSHTDVVGVQKEKWPVDPFGGVLKDGYIWGRGAVDDKDNLAASLMLMLLLKRTNAPLDRDVIFLAESGEEGETTVGIEFMANQHFNEIEAEYAIAEGGSGRLDNNGKVAWVQIQTAEKLPRRVRLVTNGTSGHGSVPRTDNALVHLSAAVAKLGTWETPMRLNNTTRTYFERLAGISPPEQAARYNGLTNPQRTAAIQKYLAENEPSHYSMLRTSVVPTILKAGFRMNVIPSEAEATIDVRALPDEDVNKFFDEMRKVIGDPAVKIERVTAGERPPTQPSRLDTEMFQALEQVTRRVYPGATPMPAMSTGATDQSFLRAKGIQSYGIGAAVTDIDARDYGAHSDVERIPEAQLYKFAEFTWAAVMEVAGAR